jgi:putative transposase
MIWKDDYNLVRPHSAIGNLAPSIYAELNAPGMQWWDPDDEGN